MITRLSGDSARLFSYSVLILLKTSQIFKTSFLACFAIGAVFSITLAFGQPSNEFIPNNVKKALKSSGLPENAIGFSITRLSKKRGDGIDQVNWQSQIAMNPASTMKLVTTMAALETLGPSYRWQTNVYTTGTISQGVLQGKVYWQGSGDPKLVPEELSKIMSTLKSQGINAIDGELVFDRSAYAPETKFSAPGDGESQRSYNVAPDPLLFSFQTLSFTMSNAAGEPEVSYTPHLAGLKIDNKLQSAKISCGDWTKHAKASIQKTSDSNWRASFVGKFGTGCPDVVWNIVAIAPNDFLAQGIMAAWEEAGGEWKQTPKVSEAKVPNNAKLLVSHQGIVLADAIKDINKFSNNVMARQVFLTLALEKAGKPASTKVAELVLKDWLKGIGIQAPELVMENGSGLSNIERISPKNLSSLLSYAIKSRSHETFVNSLPIAGVDGTMKRRLIDKLKTIFAKEPNLAKESFIPDAAMPDTLQKTGAYIKTGTLSSVRAISGYVVSKSGQVYAITSFINHPNAGKGGHTVHDSLLTWLLEDGAD